MHTKIQSIRFLTDPHDKLVRVLGLRMVHCKSQASKWLEFTFCVLDSHAAFLSFPLPSRHTKAVQVNWTWSHFIMNFYEKAGECSDLHSREKKMFLLNQPTILSHGMDLQVKRWKALICIRQQLLSIFTVQPGRHWLHHLFVTDGLKPVW